jgi:predicted nucleic acid-binding protein
VNLYLDASVIVALLTNDVFTSRADAYIRSRTPLLIVSDFAGAEVASVIARRVRTREVSEQTARIAFAELDAWTIRNAERVEMTTADVMAATHALRRLDLTLRTADALNIAIAQRVDATLMTFDEKMAVAARALGVDVAAA